MSCASLRVAALVAWVSTTAIVAGPDPPAALLGFSERQMIRQREIEERFDAGIRRENLRAWMQRLSARPHHVGSPWGKQNAEFIAGQFRSWGYRTEIEVFHVLFPTPKKRVLELLEPKKYKARLDEPALKEDATSNQQSEQLPTYNAYSVDGDVTGELVYVNYGVPQDYEELARRGIDVQGKIVIARYGGSWRGIKPKVAAEKGAAGCILYSDPRDDGFFHGDTYPRGPFKSGDGVQRGSVADMPLFPGDPLTPGVGATEDAPRLAAADAPTLTRIPVLPISYDDAQPLLLALGGPVAPESWRGALPLTYRLGPGPAKVRIQLEFDWRITPAYNVIARLEGAERPEQWILRGNHHDAWVNGANDPVSGMVALMEEARGVAELARRGETPRRTVIYAAWDAEEPGLLGSTEWVETHADTLRDKLAVYVNTDSNGRGFLYAGGSHSLERFFNEVARDVIDPQKGISVLERERARQMVLPPRRRGEQAGNREELRLGALGSGSDYTPFLQHLGIASLHFGYGGENRGGEYHSIYDSFDHYTRFGDPQFAYGAALVRTTGRAMLRLANADLLPFDFVNLAETIGGYVKEIAELTKELRRETEWRNRLIEEKRYEAAADPEQTYVAPKAEEPVPHLNFAPLHNAVAKLEKSAAALAAARVDAPEELPLELKRSLDQMLFRAERHLTRREGLPRRPWFKHQIYAPGFYTGYGVKTLPGVREAIEQRQWPEAEEQIVVAAETLERFAARIEQTTEILRSVEQDKQEKN